MKTTEKIKYIKQEDKCCVFDQAKKLFELGIVFTPERQFVQEKAHPENVMFLKRQDAQRWYDNEEQYFNIYPAYDVAELGAILPKMFKYNNSEYIIQYDCYGRPSYKGTGSFDWIFKRTCDSKQTEAFYRAEMLIYILEKNYIRKEAVQ